MKKFALATSLILALTACGGNDSGTASSTLGSDGSPQVAIPADATTQDYTCRVTHVFSDNGAPEETSTFDYSGVIHDWQEGDLFVSFDWDSSGNEAYLTKVRSEKITEIQKRSFIQQTHWERENGAWIQTVKNIERVSERENGQFRVISNKVNGVETPYDWNAEFTPVNDNQFKEIRRHKDPSSRNKDGIRYSKIEDVCSYTNR
ncbi:MAG: hypothetical protein AB7K68_00825 [Bacteriovoracia bacterium]